MSQEDVPPALDLDITISNGRFPDTPTACPFHRHLGFCETLPCTAQSIAASIAEAKAKCYFWKLSSKLREKVYKMVLSFDQKLTLSVNNGQIRLVEQQRLPRKNLLAITAVCKMTRRESMSFFFSENAFFVPVLAFDDVQFASQRKETERLRRSSSLSWLENNVFGSITAFQLSQSEWTLGFKQWIEKIGPENTASLRNVEIALGNWHLDKPTRFDTDIGRALATVRHSFRNPMTACFITMRVGIPNAQPQPCVVQIRLSITDKAQASSVLDAFFSKTFRHVDDLNAQGRISDATFSEVEDAILLCQQRLGDFLDTIFSPLPPWVKDSTHDLEQNLRSAIEDGAIGSSLQKRRSETVRALFEPSSEDKRSSTLISDERRRSYLSTNERRRSRDDRRASHISKKSYRLSHLSAYSYHNPAPSEVDDHNDHENASDWESISSIPSTEISNSSYNDSRPSYITLPQQARIVTYRRVEQAELCIRDLPPVELPTQITPKHPRKGQHLVFTPNSPATIREQREIGLDSLPGLLTGREETPTGLGIKAPRFTEHFEPTSPQTTFAGSPTRLRKRPELKHASSEPQIGKWKKIARHIRDSGFSGGTADPGAAVAAALQRRESTVAREW